jgi:hypothetical protein
LISKTQKADNTIKNCGAVDFNKEEKTTYVYINEDLYNQSKFFKFIPIKRSESEETEKE